MNRQSPVMAIVTHENEQGFAHQVANALGYPFADVVIGSPRDGATALAARDVSPRYLIIDIGERAGDILPEIDAIAEYCEEGTRVVVIGSVNDVNFYRELRTRGVIEYFTRPAKIADIRTALYFENTTGKEGAGKVIACMSAASGDGASTIALNTAYSLATEYRKSVVLVDMDYQFGMVAKNLDLTTPFGIKELFEHPDRGIDSTLIDRMIATYSTSRLKIIAAPNQLLQFPDVRAEVIRDLIAILRRDYDAVVLDLPHIWTPWVAAALAQSTHAVMVAQLWLRSVTHSSRLLSVWRNNGVNNDQISLLINRSGAKFKEAVSPRDFERVCTSPIRYYFVNDIKSVVAAENQGKTLLEAGNSLLCRQFKEFAGFFDKSDGAENTQITTSGAKAKLSGLLGKK
jgi:pilus assembly protein CpaE